MTILSRVTTGLSVSIFAACCAAFVLFGVTGMGWKALSIPTGSMRPGMPPGSLALVHSVPDNSLKVGDVITYTNPLHTSSTISHRIIKKILVGDKIPGYVTKGDANKVADIPIVAGAVQGKVVWHAPGLGYLLLWARTWIGISALIYLPAFLIVAEEIIRINNYYKSLIPYRLFGYKFEFKETPNNTWNKKAGLGTATVLVAMVFTAITAPVADALLRTNTVALTHNKITVNLSGAPGQCSGNTTNNVHINNSTTQSASSGNATVSGNTNGGNATSGNASNSNSTTITITTTNC